jgi:hypothetical protein
MITDELLFALQDPTIAAVSDADALTALQTPTSYTPRTTPITFTTLNGAAVWGFTKTATFKATLKAVVAAGGTNGAVADNLLGLLDGPGFYANDPQVSDMVPTFVALGNNTITTADASLALGTPVYRVVGSYVLADVTAARAALANYVAVQSLISQVMQFSATTVNETLNPMLTAIRAGQTVTVPASIDDLLAAWKTANGGG